MEPRKGEQTSLNSSMPHAAQEHDKHANQPYHVDGMFWSTSCDDLQALKVQRESRSTNSTCLQDMESVKRCCPALTSLNISSCRSLPASALASLLPTALPACQQQQPLDAVLSEQEETARQGKLQEQSGTELPLNSLDVSYCHLPTQAIIDLLLQGHRLKVGCNVVTCDGAYLSRDCPSGAWMQFEVLAGQFEVLAGPGPTQVWDMLVQGATSEGVGADASGADAGLGYRVQSSSARDQPGILMMSSLRHRPMHAVPELCEYCPVLTCRILQSTAAMG